VFDGSPKVWSERDDTGPICEYGRQKRDAEKAVADLGVPYLLLRLSRVIADHSCRRDLLYQWCALIHARKPIQLPQDQCFRPIAAADLGRIVMELIDSQARGLFHVAGPEQVTSPALFEMLSGALNECGVQIAATRELCRVANLPGLELRPAYTLLAIDRLQRQINLRFAPLKATVRAVAERAFALAPRHAAASVDG